MSIQVNEISSSSQPDLVFDNRRPSTLEIQPHQTPSPTQPDSTDLMNQIQQQIDFFDNLLNTLPPMIVTPLDRPIYHGPPRVTPYSNIG